MLFLYLCLFPLPFSLNSNEKWPQVRIKTKQNTTKKKKKARQQDQKPFITKQNYSSQHQDINSLSKSIDKSPRKALNRVRRSRA